MTDTVGKIEQLTQNDKEILNPKSMVPRCAALKERYFRIVKELEEMKVEIEYLCRI